MAGWKLNICASLMDWNCALRREATASGTVFLSFSFAPVFQADNDRTVRSSLTGDQTVSCYAGVVFYFGRIFQNVFQPVITFVVSSSVLPGEMLTFTMITPWSSCGTSPVLVVLIR